MPGTISADLANVLSSKGQAHQANTATLEGGSAASTAATNAEAELNDISTTLKTGFSNNIESLQAQFTQFRSTVNASEWDGGAKTRANGIVDHYEALLRQVAGEATTAVDTFQTQTKTEAESLRHAVSDGYQKVTAQFADRYTSLGTALQNYHDNLANLDDGSFQA